MNQGFPNSFTTSTNVPALVANALPQARLDFIRKTYLLFYAGLFSALIGGLVCINSPLERLITGPTYFLALIVYFGMAVGMMSLARTPGWNYVSLFAFTAFDGMMMAPWLKYAERFAPGILAQAGFLTVMVFSLLTAYTFVTQKDFSYWGSALFTGLSALISAEFANLFWFHSSGGAYWLAWITVVLFCGYILYDTSQIIQRYEEDDYCLAALSLYLDFVIMLQAIVEILMANRD
jgi:modulator of FtsH protease